MTSLGAHQISVELSAKKNFFLGNAAGGSGNRSFYLLVNDF